MNRFSTSSIRISANRKTDELIVGETSYGRNYASVVASKNVCGVQFHPEKSQSVGLKMLANFAECEEL